MDRERLAKQFTQHTSALKHFADEFKQLPDLEGTTASLDLYDSAPRVSVSVPNAYQMQANACLLYEQGWLEVTDQRYIGSEGFVLLRYRHPRLKTIIVLHVPGVVYNEAMYRMLEQSR